MITPSRKIASGFEAKAVACTVTNRSDMQYCDCILTGEHAELRNR
jgi:hypothetical protein